MNYNHRTFLGDEGVTGYQVLLDDRVLSHREVHEQWAKPEFAAFYSELLLAPQYDGLCWETPPVISATIDDEHEFVVLDSPTHARLGADPRPFQEHFDTDERVVSFPNLRGDGLMIAPVPSEGLDAGSLGPFLRSADLQQVAALWLAASEGMASRLGETPIWISTAGLGVHWLHLRIDSRPKYYRYSPYAVAPK